MTASDKVEKILIYLDINAKAFSERLGYDRPQIMYDIQRGKTKRISEELANKIVSVFPEISKSWLLADEGEMIRPSISQNATGNNNMQVAGDGNNVNVTTKSLLDELVAQRKMTELAQSQVSKSQEQIDRLLAIIERMQGL